MTDRTYGWARQLPDLRDRRLHIAGRIDGLPPVVDLRNHMPPVADQGALGSCTANMAQALYFATNLHTRAYKSPGFLGSRLFIYWWERCVEGGLDATKQDTGATIRTAVKVLAKYGAPEESRWPYDVSKYTRKPNATVTKRALSHQVTAYAAVTQDAGALRQVLAAGYPIGFGFSVYESFESDQVAATGVVPYPERTERLLGGHAVCLVGYDDTALPTHRWLCRNSWGESWGDGGYFRMSDEYILGPLAADFWTVSAVEG